MYILLKKLHFRILLVLHILECPEHYLPIFGKNVCVVCACVTKVCDCASSKT